MIRYIELKSGYHDDGPAWIARVAVSKSGRTLYFNGKALKRSTQSGSGNYYDVETTESYWLSGVKKKGGEYGDHYYRVLIVIPKEMPAEEREDGSVSRRSARRRSRAEWEGDRSRNHRAFSSAFGSPESTPQRARGDALERARLPAGASCVITTRPSALIIALCSSGVCGWP